VLDPDHPLRRRLRPLRRAVSSPTAVWRRGLPLEVEFWADWIRGGGAAFPEEYRERLDPSAPITDPLLLEAIDRTPGSVVRILDVGAGPITAVGKQDPRAQDRVIDIVAVDPLADEYNRLLRDAGIDPPVRTRRCRGEDVAEEVGTRTFDIAFARNAIDHAVDPIRIIESMVAAVCIGGTVILRHYRREGETMGYEQLHFWNFDVEDGRLVLWNRRQRVDLTARLSDRATVTARVHPGSYHSEWTEVSIRRESR